MVQCIENKENVKNPLYLLNTVGAEIEEILKNKGYEDPQSVVGIPDLSSKERLSESQIKKICKLTNSNRLRSFIQSFQTTYKEDKEKATSAYKQSKKTFTRLKTILPFAAASSQLRESFEIPVTPSKPDFLFNKL